MQAAIVVQWHTEKDAIEEQHLMACALPHSDGNLL